MTASKDLLFRPFDFGPLHLENRLVMAPMTRGFSPNGVPGDDVAEYYRKRAAGGTGLIITEGTTVDHHVATSDRNFPRFHGEDSLAGWKNVVDTVHAAGGKIMPQLWHVGMMRNAKKSDDPDTPSAGPSGMNVPGKVVGPGMTESDIQDVISAFGKGAADAKATGFDGIEIHGAHGYLIDQFFWDGTNIRDDKWGGSLDKRVQFGVEVVKACRAAVGPDFPVLIRVSQWKQQDFTQKLTQNPAELEQFLGPLSDAGVDIFHASTRRFWEPEFEGSNLNYAGWTKKITGKPTITVGSVGLSGGDFIGAFQGQGSEAAGLDELLERMANDEFDLVAVGRALLANPDWANLVRDGRDGDIRDYAKESLAALV